jgi:pimeloyl-ACP methyl ester carboxylesterase
MQAFFFGAPPRRLFGIFHAAQAPRAARAAVLLCNPFGQEAVRAHRMLRVLAQRLARAGLDVLRFDPYGSGDSAGEDTELDLEGWSADVLTAAGELQRRSGAGSQWWIGARLGATVACRAATRASHPVQGLVLCEPVLDGPAYLRSLAVATVAALEATCSIKDPRWREQLANQPELLEREAIGFSMGETLHRQLGALRADGIEAPLRTRVWLVGSGAQPELAALAAAWSARGIRASHEVLPFDFDWTAEEALNTALVPHEMVQYLANLAEGGGGGT